MTMDLSTIQPLLQRGINLMETASCWERKAAMKAHVHGLQGEKRRMRYLYRKARNIVDWVEHSAYDVLKDQYGKGIELCAQAGTTDVSSLRCPQSTMEGIIEKLWTIRKEAHKIANELVLAEWKEFSCPFYDYVECVFKILSELQRNHCEYVQAAYEYHHISRYQVAWYNVHDEYECKEEEQGYKEYY